MRRRSPLVKLFSPLTWSFLTMIVLAVVGMFVLFSTKELRKPQDIRQQASGGETGAVSFRLRPDKTTVEKNQTVIVDVMMNTANNNISAVDLTGQIKQVAVSLILSNTAESGLNTAYMNQDTQNTQIDWRMVTFASTTNNQLYSTNNREAILASLVIKPTATGTLKVSSTAEVTGDQGQTTIIPEVNITVTEVQASNPPDMGIHRGCNEYCADSRECQSQYTCYYNRCRNPRNINDEKCAEPPSPRPAPSVPPRGGSRVSPRPSPRGGVVPSPRIIDVKSKPAVTPPAVGSYTLDGKGATKSAGTPTPTPSPRSSPISSPSPSPSPSPVQSEKSKGGSNLFLIVLLSTLLLGGVAGLAYVLIKYRG